MPKTTKQFFILRDQIHLDNCINFLRKTVCDGRTCVEVKDYVKNRSDAQNRLYWAYMGVFAKETGDSKEMQHLNFASTLLGFDEVPGMRQGEEVVFIRPRHTSTLTTQEFTDYLRKIEMTAAKMGWRLPVPDDYNYAMGN